jgi:hypothetical protein
MDKDQLARMLDDGWSFSRIGKEVGLNPSTVSYWAHKFGLESTHRRAHAPRGSLSRAVLAELVARDLTVREIAAQVDRSVSTIRYWLRLYALKTTERARLKNRRKPRTPGTCPRHGPADFIGRRDGQLVCLKCRAAAVSDWRRRAKETLVREAGGRCQVCGYDRCAAALQFHHVDPTSKSFGLGSRGLARSIEALREEAAKCVLVCATCHAEIEAGVAALPLVSGRPLPSLVARGPG